MVAAASKANGDLPDGCSLKASLEAVIERESRTRSQRTLSKATLLCGPTESMLIASPSPSMDSKCLLAPWGGSGGPTWLAPREGVHGCII